MHINKVPCKDYYCSNDRASGYLYCTKHKEGKEEIDDLAEAAKYCEREFKISEDSMVKKKTNRNGATTYVYRDKWMYFLEIMGRAWDVKVDDLEEKLKRRLYSEYGEIRTST